MPRPEIEPNTENCIEWFTGAKTACISSTQPKMINRIKELAKTRKEVKDLTVNDDGSVCVNIPASWIKINPPRELSEEVRAEMAERVKGIKNKQAPNLTKSPTKMQNGTIPQEGKRKRK